MSEREHDCQLHDWHDWQTIGTVTADCCSLVIADPSVAATLASAWRKRVEDEEPWVQFEEMELRGERVQTHPRIPQGQFLARALVVDTPGNGGFDVDARFCDYWGHGDLRVCEVRIRLHRPHAPHAWDDPELAEHGERVRARMVANGFDPDLFG